MTNLHWVEFPAAMVFDEERLSWFLSRFAREFPARTKKKLYSTNWCTSAHDKTRRRGGDRARLNTAAATQRQTAPDIAEEFSYRNVKLRCAFHNINIQHQQRQHRVSVDSHLPHAQSPCFRGLTPSTRSITVYMFGI